MTYVDASVTAIARAATKDSLIVGKSTVPVGSARRLKGVVAEESRDGVTVNFAWNPEFLREGFAVEDTLRPDRLVIGTDSEAAEKTLREVYADALSRNTRSSPPTSRPPSWSRLPRTPSWLPKSPSSTPTPGGRNGRRRHPDPGQRHRA